MIVVYLPAPISDEERLDYSEDQPRSKNGRFSSEQTDVRLSVAEKAHLLVTSKLDDHQGKRAREALAAHKSGFHGVAREHLKAIKMTHPLVTVVQERGPVAAAPLQEHAKVPVDEFNKRRVTDMTQAKPHTVDIAKKLVSEGHSVADIHGPVPVPPLQEHAKVAYAKTEAEWLRGAPAEPYAEAMERYRKPYGITPEQMEKFNRVKQEEKAARLAERARVYAEIKAAREPVPVPPLQEHAKVPAVAAAAPMAQLPMHHILRDLGNQSEATHNGTHISIASKPNYKKYIDGMPHETETNTLNINGKPVFTWVQRQSEDHSARFGGAVEGFIRKHFAHQQAGLGDLEHVLGSDVGTGKYTPIPNEEPKAASNPRMKLKPNGILADMVRKEKAAKSAAPTAPSDPSP